jgi:hypothetical protein
MSKNKLWLLIAIVAIGLIGYAWIAYAAHPSVTVKDAAGNAVQGGTNTPYSPKQTCGGCHYANCDTSSSHPQKWCQNTQSSNFIDYENTAANITKQQTVGGTANPSYTVKVASHGVTAGYHFQQGMNVPWGQTQRDFYGLPPFTSSPGMVGKY